MSDLGLVVDPKDESWMDEGACYGVDPEFFFPEKGGHAALAVAEAKRICAGCPVQAVCLEYALANNERWGVWGGKSEKERGRLRRARLLHRVGGST